MASFRTEQWVPYPVSEVFAFFSNPQNLPRILSPSQRARIEQIRLTAPADDPGLDQKSSAGWAGVGTEVEISLRPVPLVPIRTKWIARITAFSRNQFFEDEQIRGPFQRWHHRHEFEVSAQAGQTGTVVRDIVDFDAGFGVVGRLAAALFIRRQLRSTFAHRQQVLEQLLREGSASGPSSRRLGVQT